MIQADRIRAHVLGRYLEPSRAGGQATVRAGDVIADLSLRDSAPAVCSALASQDLQRWAAASLQGATEPNPSTTTVFTYRLAPEPAPFSRAEAEAFLRRSYGEPIVATDKMSGFQLPDGRQVAVQRDVERLTVWLEDAGSPEPPPLPSVETRGATQGRHSNLPPRLKHNPPAGLVPRPVLVARPATALQFLTLLAWYDRTDDAMPAAPVKSAAPQETPSSQKAAMRPTNLILHGPPGTGKTYATAAEAVRICDSLAVKDPLLQPAGREALMRRYQELREARRIEFVTFHQSYGYEDFVEGLRPVQVVAEDGQTAPGFSLQPTPGVFRNICRRALASTGAAGGAFSLGDRRVFKMSIGEAANPEQDYLFEEAIETGRVLLGWGDEVDWSDEAFSDRDAMIAVWQGLLEERGDHTPVTALTGQVKYPYALRNKVRNGDLIVVSKGNSFFRAIGEITGPYEYVSREEDDYANQRPVRWLWVDRDGLPAEDIYAYQFTQSPLYELRRSALRVAALESYASAGAAPAGPPDPYVLIIDEINRGNISKIFGELITLLEPDKRMSTAALPNPEGLTVQLPFSRDTFGVPPNLHVIGTMNSADRSIALLDTALRRRFRFRELMPRPELLPTDVGGVNLQRVLARLNERIEHLFDREHQIGHAFFLKCRTRSDVDDVMRHEVIPLLAEYFHEGWDRIWTVLAEPEEGDEGGFLVRRRLSVGNVLDEDAEGRWRYSVKDLFPPDAYVRLAG